MTEVEMANWEDKLKKREDRLAEREEAVRLREGKFANRLREFNADL